MLIIEFDRPPTWSLDTNKTGESAKYPWVGVVGSTARERETVAAALLCLMFKGHGQILMSLSVKSINNFLPWRKKPVKSEKYNID